MDNGWGFMMFLGVIGVLGLVAIVFWMISTSRSTPLATGTPPPAVGSGTSDRSPTAGAEQILAERLARGDIDTEEYSTRLSALMSLHRT